MDPRAKYDILWDGADILLVKHNSSCNMRIKALQKIKPKRSKLLAKNNKNT